MQLIAIKHRLVLIVLLNRQIRSIIRYDPEPEFPCMLIGGTWMVLGRVGLGSEWFAQASSPSSVLLAPNHHRELSVYAT